MGTLTWLTTSQSPQSPELIHQLQKLEPPVVHYMAFAELFPGSC